jgi:hypothetical protein
MIGGARKTLPTRRARKVSRPNRSGARQTRAKNVITREQEQEWVKIFGQK